VFVGHGDFRTVQIKLAVSVPHHVFNRPAVERQLEAMREEFSIQDIRLELVPTQTTEHAGPQFEEFGDVAGLTMLSPTGRFELHITLGRKEWGTGVGLSFDLKPPDGLRLGGSYSNRSIFLEDDRWRGRAYFGANQFTYLTTNTTFIDISRGFAEWTWATPQLPGVKLRPSTSTYFDYRGRGRTDIDIEFYRWVQFGFVGSAGYDITDNVNVSLGAGFEARWLFDIQQPTVPSGGRPVPPSDEVLALFNVHSTVVLDPDNVRIDRHHLVDFDARLLLGADHMPRLILRGEYQQFIAFGWHDLVVRGRAIGSWGYIRFVDEESLGWFLRGAFGNTHWLRRCVGGTAEFRFSMIRDLFKVGAFIDAAFFQAPGRRRSETRLMSAGVAGPGLHFLLLDIFQFDFYYSFGIDTDGFFEHGFSMGVRKAF
jgi:hypothetical protein